MLLSFWPVHEASGAPSTLFVVPVTDTLPDGVRGAIQVGSKGVDFDRARRGVPAQRVQARRASKRELLRHQNLSTPSVEVDGGCAQNPSCRKSLEVDSVEIGIAPDDVQI